MLRVFYMNVNLVSLFSEEWE